jgi:hypothetical protein
MTQRFPLPPDYDEEDLDEEDLLDALYSGGSGGQPPSLPSADDLDIPYLNLPPGPRDPTLPPLPGGAPGGAITTSGGIGKVRDHAAVAFYENSYEGLTVTERNSFKRFYTDYARAAASLFKKAPEDLSRSQVAQLDALVGDSIPAPEIRPEDDPETSRARRSGASQARAARRMALSEEAAGRARETYDYNRGLRPLQEERSTAAAARAAESYGYSVSQRSIAAERSRRAEERAQAAADRASRGEGRSIAAEARASGRFQADEIVRTTPKPLPAEKPPAATSRLPNLTWQHVSVLIPPEDLANLTSAWSAGSDGESAISSDHWRYIQALIPLSPAVPILARHLRSLYLGSGGARRSTRSTVYRPNTTANPFRTPSFRRPRGG